MKGAYKRLLEINLSEQRFEIQPIAAEVFETYLGGKGLGAYLLTQRNPVGVDPLSPDNHLIFTTGAVAGGVTWGSSRYGVFTKSPLTGFFCEAYSGGRVPEAIAATGFDAVVIHGRAQALSLLNITPSGVEFVDGQDYAGLNTFETEDRLTQDFSDATVRGWKTGTVVTGPAAENGVKFAIIKNDGWRCAGRGGTGTVLGSKRIKAIRFSGNQKRTLHNPEALKELAREMAGESQTHPVVQAYKTMGTAQMVKIMNTAKAFPAKYWTLGQAPHWEKISADALHSRCKVTPHPCAKCFIACGRMTTIQEGRHRDLVVEGPEYETLYVFGGICMVESIEEITWLNHICDGLGMDTISAGNLVGFAMAAAEQGKIDESIAFGDSDAIADLLNKIAHRQGIGDILAQGIVHAARTWGMEDTAVHVKGMDPAGYDPRVLKGMGLAYATSDRGACHLRSTVYKAELSGMADPDQTVGKSPVFIDFEDRLTLFDALILCKFFRDIYGWELLGEIIQGSTGLSGSRENLEKLALNISSLVRDFNLREGMTPADETLPPALHKPLEDSGAVISPEEVAAMVTEYKSLRGWTD
ncbi:MAG: aldehyde ferredoxin oxidoreductase family protein [Desulfobacterales bacterium]|nr:aldehyde ferredoxin oxidoreductase family protein [Desulfobacterales bacterium]